MVVKIYPHIFNKNEFYGVLNKYAENIQHTYYFVKLLARLNIHVEMDEMYEMDQTY